LVAAFCISVFVGRLLKGGNARLTIQMHDTYIIILHRHILYALASYFLVFAALYQGLSLLTDIDKERIQFIHLIGSLILIIIFFWGVNEQMCMPKYYYALQNAKPYQYFNYLTQILAVTFLFLLIINLIFFLLKLFRLLDRIS
jgi:heme/copper-type cytochrome/quinol oxidase subunit 1